MRKLSTLSHLLVSLQFAAIVVIAWPFVTPEAARLVWLGVSVPGILIGVYTVFHNRFGNFGIYPEPLEDACLITSGPYQWIRHPMYSSLLLTMAGVALYLNAWPNYLGLLLLALAVLGKMRIEERHLHLKFADYSDYVKRTRRLLPGVY